MKKLYLQKELDDEIWSAIQRARMVNHELNKIQQIKAAGLSNSTPNAPHTPRVLNRPVPIGHIAQRLILSTVQSTSSPVVKRTSAPLDRLQSVKAEIVSVYYVGDNHNKDPITYMIHATLDDNKDMNPDDSIVIKTKLNLSSPDEYSGSSDLEVYKIFAAGTLHWLKMTSLPGTKHAPFQVEYLGTRLKDNGHA